VTPAFIPSPSQSGFHLGPLDVHVYGLMYVLAVLAAVVITRRRWGAAGGDPELVYEVAMWGFPAGLIGGRIYFLITTPSQIPDAWWGPFAIWKGGLGIWGGIAAGVAAGLTVLYRRLDPYDVRRFMDAAAPSLLVAQSFGRIGNYFNQELFGGPTTLPWGLKIDPAHRPPGYTQYATFHPTFLYEIVWNLSLASFLVWLGHHRRIRPPGLFALYVAGYSGFRIFEETLRVDYSNHIFGLRLNFFVALVLCIIGLVWFVAIQREWSAPSWFPRFHPRRRGSRPAAKPPARTGSQKKPGSRSGTRVGSDKRSAGKARPR
jgi:prolipoprotein diacylglyceryl transferase